MDHIKEITDHNFEAEVINSEMPVMVDFWAPWCGPCRMVGPIVEELARDYPGKLKVAKMNIDDSPNTAAGLGISAIPTIMLFKGGEIAERFVGVQPKNRLQRAVDQALD
ncbi:MAG: thioredoxin [Pirellulales bacterium]|nr:thioredoxin [Pirellulales bacterium]